MSPWVLLRNLLSGIRSDDFPTALHSVLGLVLFTICTWVALTLVIAVFNRRWATAFAPPLLRGLLAASLTVGLTSIAHAGTQNTNVDVLSGLQLPERSVSEPDTPVQPVKNRTGRASSTVHVVRAGDTLWGIATSRLGTDAPVSEIQEAVSRWHENNSDVLGPDPNLIHPGQQLKEPQP